MDAIRNAFGKPAIRVLTLLLAGALMHCGSSSSKKSRGPTAPSEAASGVDDGSVDIQGGPSADDAAEKSAEDMSAEQSVAPKIGWLDPAIGYRFQYLEAITANLELADPESEELALYLGMSKAERQAVLQAQKQSEANFISIIQGLSPLVPALGLVLQVRDILVQYGINFESSPSYRKSLCERELGAGWHFPRREVLKNGIEDGLLAAVPSVAEKDVWIAQDGWIHDVFEVRKSALDPGGPRMTTASNVHHVLCASRDFSVAVTGPR